MCSLSSSRTRRSYHKRAITAVSLRLFMRSAGRNLRGYPRCFQFWWPIIDARAARHKVCADDLLLNPVFRWAFLARADKLDAFENQLTLLESALGSIQCQTFREQLLQDISNHGIENDTHNRLLSALTEVRAILSFSSDGYTITLIPRLKNQKTPDFRADRKSRSSLVEVKYIRPPDKLEEYLLRWWQAQKEVAQEIPQGLLPHLRFDWEPVGSRAELSRDEIASLKDLFATALQKPNQAHELTSGRLIVQYVPGRKLPVTTEPLATKGYRSEATREGIFAKIKAILDRASTQLAMPQGPQLRKVFLAINLSPDIDFLWRERFEERFEGLRQQFVHKGVQVEVEEVGYL
jgi:hypothetical protein